MRREDIKDTLVSYRIQDNRARAPLDDFLTVRVTALRLKQVTSWTTDTDVSATLSHLKAFLLPALCPIVHHLDTTIVFGNQYCKIKQLKKFLLEVETVLKMFTQI
jgi:hypothetical protein